MELTVLVGSSFLVACVRRAQHASGADPPAAVLKIARLKTFQAVHLRNALEFVCRGWCVWELFARFLVLRAGLSPAREASSFANPCFVVDGQQYDFDTCVDLSFSYRATAAPPGPW
eukprot:1838725-Pyramimonas_sp.AAC.1